jgi:hypothetical protein
MWILLALLLLVPGTATAFWPVVWDLDGERNILGPTVSYREGEKGPDVVVRPFLFSFSAQEQESHFLYPLGKSTPTKSYFVPFYMWKKSEDAEDRTIVLVYWGHSKGRQYGGFFPFFGRMYNRFGKDELGFFLWPLYSFSVDDGARKDDVLYPLFSLYGGTDEGFKAWPLYGQRTRPGVRRWQFALWPIFYRDERNLDTDDPVKVLQVFPLYSENVSRARQGYSLLWPFFHYYRDEDKEKWQIPWPLFSYTTGKETKGFSFLPFVHEEEQGRDRYVRYLWPLYVESEWYVRNERYSIHRVLLLNRRVEEPGKAYTNVWPVAEQRNVDGEERYFFPSILPFFRFEPFDRIMRPLITVMDLKRTETKEVLNFLWGFTTYERQGEDRKVRVAFLFEWEKKGDRTGFEILSGLYGRGTDGSRKVFFVPFKNEAADPPKDPQ